MCLFLEKCSKDLQRRERDDIKITAINQSIMVHSGLSETEEAEAFAWDLGNREVRSRVTVVQVVVVVSRRSISSHEDPSFETSMTQDLRW